ncbi:hypothetical protein [Pengzhenrongella sp.]|uniref:hypothetical protein n=1 Tax=Pengzhenrongella sp. TaxID=2888820 RepID=UPI002F95E385
MGRHGRQGFNRRRTLREVGVAWLVLCGLGLIVSAGALAFYAGDAPIHQLEVFYLPADPQQVMTRMGIGEYRHDVLAGDLAGAALGIAPSALTALAWWATRFSRRHRGQEPEKGHTSADV